MVEDTVPGRTIPVRMVPVPGARLAVQDRPPGDDPAGTVVALHAGVADQRVWNVCAEAWTALGWRVVTYDRRGFGASEWEAVAHDPVADLLAVLDELAIETAVLVGNSMGGLLALDTALAHPDRVRALVLVASAISGQPWQESDVTDAERALGEAVGRADAAGDVDAVNRIEAHYWLDGPAAPEGRVAGPERELFLAMNGRALEAPPTGDETSHPDVWDRLDQLTVPTLVVVGTGDEATVVTGARHLGEAIADAELVEIAGSAHLPMLDAIESFLDATTTFLAELSGR